MRWSTYVSPSDNKDRVGLVVGETIHGLAPGLTLIELLRMGGAALQDYAAAAIDRPSELIELSRASLRAPVPTPPSIRDFMAFEAHVKTSMRALNRELHPDWYQLPVFYFTNPVSARGAREAVKISPGSQAFDYELEVAAIIGSPGSDIAVEDARSHIAGFCLMADWSARDLQAREMQMGLGPSKGKDGAMSFGPFMVTPDELEERIVGHSHDMALSAFVNDKPYSSRNLADIYWSFAEMISYASRGTRLVTGDVIGSGTVGTGCIVELRTTSGPEAYPWLSEGDRVRLSADILGSIDVRIERGTEPLPLRR